MFPVSYSLLNLPSLLSSLAGPDTALAKAASPLPAPPPHPHRHFSAPLLTSWTQAALSSPPLPTAFPIPAHCFPPQRACYYLPRLAPGLWPTAKLDHLFQPPAYISRLVTTPEPGIPVLSPQSSWHGQTPNGPYTISLSQAGLCLPVALTCQGGTSFPVPSNTAHFTP